MPAHGPAGAVTTSLHAWELDRPGPGEMWCEEAASQAPAADAGASKRQGVIVVALPMPMNISRRTAACYREAEAEAEADRWATPPTRSRGAWALRIRISTRGGMQKPAAWRPCVAVDGYGQTGRGAHSSKASGSNREKGGEDRRRSSSQPASQPCRQRRIRGDGCCCCSGKQRRMLMHACTCIVCCCLPACPPLRRTSCRSPFVNGVLAPRTELL
jgi:hypothetical protein